MNSDGSLVEISPSTTVTNPGSGSRQIDFAIDEVTEDTSEGRKNFRITKYVLKDARTSEVLKESAIIKKRFTGGCKPGHECFVRFGFSHDSLGTSKTAELKELIDYAVSYK